MFSLIPWHSFLLEDFKMAAKVAIGVATYQLRKKNLEVNIVQLKWGGPRYTDLPKWEGCLSAKLSLLSLRCEIYVSLNYDLLNTYHVCRVVVPFQIDLCFLCLCVIFIIFQRMTPAEAKKRAEEREQKQKEKVSSLYFFNS